MLSKTARPRSTALAVNYVGFTLQATDPSDVARVSFQNPDSARQLVKRLFGYDLATGLVDEEWAAIVKSLQKRHLLAHRMGVVDQDYLNRTGDRNVVKGQKINVSELGSKNEVERIVAYHLEG